MLLAAIASSLAALSFGGGLLGLILMIAVLGVVVWLVTAYIPMPPVFKTIIYIVAVIILIIVLIRALGGGDVSVSLLDQARQILA
jgi:hypothetical protein